MTATRPIITIDAETDPFALAGESPRAIDAFLWGSYDGQKSRHWWDDVDGFVAWLRTQRVVAYAHNLGRFDSQFLLKYLTPKDKITIVNGVPLTFTLGRAEIRDSLKILPVALSKISKMRFDYAKMLRENRDKHRDEIIYYCLDDCIQLYDAVTEFEGQYGRSLTIGGAAIKAHDAVEDSPIPKLSESRHQRFSPYYFGGRCEVFPGAIGRIRGTTWIYDISSAYPHACSTDHLAGAERVSKTLPDHPHYFATIRAGSLGALPRRDSESDHLIYDRDGLIRTYNATGWEIRAGVDTGTLIIDDVIEVWEFESRWSAPEFVSEFYDLKSDTDDPNTRLFAKLILNNLYGRLAMDGSRHRDYKITASRHIDHWLQRGWSFLGELSPDNSIMSRPVKDPKYHDVAIGASITGFVRAKLWRSIQKIGEDNVDYCDTDSIFSRAKMDIAEMGGGLGTWEHEGTAISGGYAARKLYALKIREYDACDTCGHTENRHHNNGAGCLNRRCECRSYVGPWKTASKGARLTPTEILNVIDGGVTVFNATAPTYSIARGARFLTRTFKRENRAE